MEERGKGKREIGEEGRQQVWERIEWVKEERVENIKGSRCNRWYKEVLQEGIAEAEAEVQGGRGGYDRKDRVAKS